ncbi:MAG: branched-chain amino acid transaminase [Gammaproteobacteria bacterium]
MQTTDVIWFNGKLVPWHDAKIHVLTHALHYGSGAFEGIRFYKTPTGSAIFRLPEHVDRLIFSADVLGMLLPYDRDTILEAIIQTAKANHLEEGYLRPILYYGYGKMGVNPVGCPVDFAVACWPWKAYLAQDCADIKTSRYIRIHPDSTNVSAKLTGHYVNSILGSLELRNTHYHEALFLDSKGFISEGAGENFFLVKEGRIFTPTLETILPGITRDTIIQIAHELGYEVTETNLTLAQAHAADEAFFTGTAVEVTAIRSIDDQLIAKGEMGPITQRIKTAYLAVVRGENPDYQKYLTAL